MKRIVSFVVTLLLVASFFVALPYSAQSSVSAQKIDPLLVIADSANPNIQWDLTIDLNPELARLSSGEQSALLAPLQAEGVSASVADGTLSLSGSSDLAQLRQTLFNTDQVSFDFLGGPVELTVALPADGTPLTLNLETRNTAGYTWQVLPTEAPGFTQVGKSDFAMVYQAKGAPSIQTITLEPNGEGDAAVKLIYARSFEPETPVHARLSVVLAEPVSLIELSNPAPVAPVSNPALETIPLEDMPVKSVLPPAYDARTAGLVTPVRDQGAYGSCWAFGTVGVMESALLKGGGPSTDLSEQFLVSCNTYGWGNGGLTASMFHYDTLGLNQSVVGAVLESDKPYIAQKGTCSVTYNHPHKLDNWAFIIAGGDWGNPTTAQIKTAIQTYGPITAGVCVGPNFNAYNDGVLIASDNICNGSSNHQIVLVGWDDATSSWILKNSWGSGWGEDGYMRIHYDISLVGQGTSWATYTSGPAPTIPTTYTPTGQETYTKFPTYSWSVIPGASNYTLAINDKVLLKNVFRKTISAATYCSETTGRCSYTPNKELVRDRVYRWKVATNDGITDGTFTGWRLFTARVGLNNSFNNEMAGWTVRPGAEWFYASNAYIATDGAADAWSSIGTTYAYNNFTYEVKLKRDHTTVSNYATGLVVRAHVPYTSENAFYNSYSFLFTSNGYFAVGKDVANVGTTLQTWTSSPAIVQTGWNRLKVTAENKNLRFYINDILVWSGTDSSLTAGQLGIFMAQPASGVGAGNGLQVDWAKLSMSDFYKASPALESGQVVLQQSGSEPFDLKHTP